MSRLTPRSGRSSPLSRPRLRCDSAVRAYSSEKRWLGVAMKSVRRLMASMRAGVATLSTNRSGPSGLRHGQLCSPRAARRDSSVRRNPESSSGPGRWAHQNTRCTLAWLTAAAGPRRSSGVEVRVVQRPLPLAAEPALAGFVMISTSPADGSENSGANAFVEMRMLWIADFGGSRLVTGWPST